MKEFTPLIAFLMTIILASPNPDTTPMVHFIPNRDSIPLSKRVSFGSIDTMPKRFSYPRIEGHIDNFTELQMTTIHKVPSPSKHYFQFGNMDSVTNYLAIFITDTLDGNKIEVAHYYKKNGKEVDIWEIKSPDTLTAIRMICDQIRNNFLRRY